jgi:hypothetical protein
VKAQFRPRPWGKWAWTGVDGHKSELLADGGNKTKPRINPAQIDFEQAMFAKNKNKSKNLA